MNRRSCACGGAISSASLLGVSRWDARSTPCSARRADQLVPTGRPRGSTARRRVGHDRDLLPVARRLEPPRPPDAVRSACSMPSPQASVEWVDAMIELGDLCRFQGTTTMPRCFSRRSLDVVDPTEFASDPISRHGRSTPSASSTRTPAATTSRAHLQRSARAGDGGGRIRPPQRGVAVAQPRRPRPRPRPPRTSRTGRRPSRRIRERTSDPTTTSSPKISPYSAPRSSTTTASTDAEQRSIGPCESFEAANQQTDTTSPSTSATSACRLQRNDGAGAEALFRQGLSIKKAIFGDHHPEIARQLNNLAVAVASTAPRRGRRTPPSGTDHRPTHARRRSSADTNLSQRPSPGSLAASVRCTMWPVAVDPYDADRRSGRTCGSARSLGDRDAARQFWRWSVRRGERVTDDPATPERGICCALVVARRPVRRPRRPGGCSIVLRR